MAEEGTPVVVEAAPAPAPVPAPVEEVVDHLTALQRVLRKVRPLKGMH